MNFTHTDKMAAREIIGFTIDRIESGTDAAALSFDELHENVSDSTTALSEEINDLNERHFDINRPQISPSRPDTLTAIKHQRFRTLGSSFPVPARLVERETFRAFQRMNYQMKKDIGRELIIQSGYRSPAYQLFVFLFNLRDNDWNVSDTLESVALPGYSEHAGDPHALDLRVKEFLGPVEGYEFERTAEYRWLKKHADEFGFSMSYPQNNGTETRFEPWHWRYSHSLS